MVYTPEDDPNVELSEFDKSIIGGSRRITIPLDDRLMLREVADMLRGLATTMDFQSRRPDISERSALFAISCEICSINRRIKDCAKRHGRILREGRPKDSERLGHNGKINGTRETV